MKLPGGLLRNLSKGVCRGCSLSTQPERVYLDANCTTKLPLPLPSPDKIQIHRISIALGCSENGKVRDLAIVPGVTDDGEKYAVGKNKDTKGWIHVFNENTLSVVMHELSTITDFIEYLQKKEQLLDSGKLVRAETELDMLASFLWSGREFKVPDQQFYFEPNLWKFVDSSPEFLKAREDNAISVFWDRLIERFTASYMKEELQFGNDTPVSDHERSVRLMAAEHRFGRRLLTNWILDRSSPPEGKYAGSLMESPSRDDVLYVLLMGPGAPRDEYEQYRSLRTQQLRARCFAAKAARPSTSFIIGIGLDRRGSDGGSEDLFYMDVRNWTPEEMEISEKVRSELGYFVKGKMQESKLQATEYPSVV